MISTIAIMLLLALSFLSPLAFVQAQQQESCNCVVFRLDDIQDYWLTNAQITILDLFAEKNASLSAGVIVNLFGDDIPVVDKVIEANQEGRLELGIHGYDHVDYTKLSPEEQNSTIALANSKLSDITGNKTNLFITPFNRYDENTIAALQDNDIHIISASYNADTKPIEDRENNFKAVRPDGETPIGDVYRLTQTVTFADNEEAKTTWHTVPEILDLVHDGIEQRGYAVITLHPQDLLVRDPSLVTGDNVAGIAEDQMVPQHLADMETLIDTLKDEGINLVTFQDVVNFSK